MINLTQLKNFEIKDNNFYINSYSEKKNCYEWKKVNAKPIKLPLGIKIDLFLEERDGYTITEGITGCRVANGKTVKDTENQVIELIKTQSGQIVLEQIIKRINEDLNGNFSPRYMLTQDNDFFDIN